MYVHTCCPLKQSLHSELVNCMPITHKWSAWRGVESLAFVQVLECAESVTNNLFALISSTYSILAVFSFVKTSSCYGRALLPHTKLYKPITDLVYICLQKKSGKWWGQNLKTILRNSRKKNSRMCWARAPKGLNIRYLVYSLVKVAHHPNRVRLLLRSVKLFVCTLHSVLFRQHDLTYVY